MICPRISEGRGRTPYFSSLRIRICGHSSLSFNLCMLVSPASSTISYVEWNVEGGFPAVVLLLSLLGMSAPAAMLCFFRTSFEHRSPPSCCVEMLQRSTYLHTGTLQKFTFDRTRCQFKVGRGEYHPESGGPYSCICCPSILPSSETDSRKYTSL